MPTQRIQELVAQDTPRLIALRRHLHQHPELSHQETNTAAYLAASLRERGFAPRTHVGGHGLVVDIFGNHPGRSSAFRVDMDALPIQEQHDSPFASTKPGIMHACGHDAHMAIGVGVASVLQSLRDDLHGSVRLIFQPAEETIPSGAEAMMADGVLSGVEAIWTVHVDPSLPANTVGLRSGPVTAGTDLFFITVRGKAGHSARPHLARDANFAAAQLLGALYHLAPTRFDPREPMVVNVGVMRGGEAPNAIAGEAVLEGCVRVLSATAREKIPEILEELVQGVAKTHGVTATLELRRGAPSQVNDLALTKHTEASARRIVGSHAVLEIPLPSLGGEDFSRYTYHGKTPGVLVRLGSAIEGKTLSLHSGDFTLDEGVIPTGVAAITQTLLDHNKRPR